MTNLHPNQYNESHYNISPAVFPIIDEHRPQLYILPNLHTLVWRCETQAGLDRSLLFLNPQLEQFTLDIGMRLPNLEAFIEELPKRVKLTSFAISSITPLPANFTAAMQDQHSIENLSLNIPGALSPDMGWWASSLPKLHSLNLNLTARSTSAIESFFAQTDLRSGYSTPSSVGGTDSGVFSGGEDTDLLDFRKDLRKSALRLTGDYPASIPCRPSGAFPLLRDIQLSGDVGAIATFLKHIRSEVTVLDLKIDDPPQPLDWQELCTVLYERFSTSLQTLRIAAANTSRPESVRVTSRGEVNISIKHLSLRDFPALPRLEKLDIDLPQSVLFEDADVARVAIACPALRVLRLSPSARFPIPFGPPRLTLEGLAELMRGCAYLHTLAVVFCALPGSERILGSRDYSSESLLKLNVGHSWTKDPLQTAILLSHLAPRLTQLKFFHDASRVGYIAAHANAWQQAAAFLPHLQRLRAAERHASQQALNGVLRALAQPPSSHASDAVYAPKLGSIMEDELGPETEDESSDEESLIVVAPQKIDQAVDATPRLVDTAVGISPTTAEAATSPLLMVLDLPVTVDAATSPITDADQYISVSVSTSPLVRIEDLPLEFPPASHEDELHVVVSSSEQEVEPSSVSTGPLLIPTPLTTSPSTPIVADTSRSFSYDGSYPSPPPPTSRGDPSIASQEAPTASSDSLFSVARDAVTTLPLYASLLIIRTSLAMLGARPKMPHGLGPGSDISPVCI
jgi:hypothetical protein